MQYPIPWCGQKTSLCMDNAYLHFICITWSFCFWQLKNFEDNIRKKKYQFFLIILKNSELVCICNSCSIVLDLRRFRDLVKRLVHFENALSISHDDAGVFNAIAATRFNIGNLVPNFWKNSEGRKKCFLELKTLIIYSLYII